MARTVRGHSPSAVYRRSRQNVADLEAALAKLEGSRPRTPAAKGWITRRIAATRKAFASARGQLTKAKNAIAAQTVAKRTTAKTTKAAATSMRSAAAKRGHETRRKRAAQPAPSRPSSGTGRFMPMLTENGLRYLDPVGSDRSLVGKYWNVVERLLNTGANHLGHFAGKSVWDSYTGVHFPFITESSVILTYADEFDFGTFFYKSRGEVENMGRFAA